MPRGYFFGEFEITDPATYEVYRAKVPDIISAHGGRILVRGGDPQPFDGTMLQRRFVLVEFDSPAAARRKKVRRLTSSRRARTRSLSGGCVACEPARDLRSI